MSEQDHEQDIVQFSEQSRKALAEAAQQLTERLQAHTAALLALDGQADLDALFDQNAELEDLVESWNDAVLDHTGTIPLALVDLDDIEEDEDDQLETDEIVSVVSRFDLRVADLDTLLAAGRAAQERILAEDEETDLREPIGTAEQAIYAISREFGEAWFALPGVELIAAARAYVVPEEPFEALQPEAEDIVTELTVPNGTVSYMETWA